jgi:PAS domain S-box-containing protein
MTKSPFMTRWGSVWLWPLLLTISTFCASAAAPKRILILNPFGHDVAPFSTAISAFRATLARELEEPADVYEIPLELARIEEPEGEVPLVDFLEGRIKSHPVDLVVLVGGASAQFAFRHRDRLFPDTPVLLVGADSRFVPPDLLRANVAMISEKVNLQGMVEDILQMQPQTTNIAVVLGASALEKAWGTECRREFQAFTNRVGFTWLNDLPLDQIVKRCATLPPRSFILQPLFVVDAAGVPDERSEALRRIHQTANAPVFAYAASELGMGSIGGHLFQDVEVGARAARLAIRMLHGEKPAGIPPQVLEVGTPTYDWRELKRWGISQANLPAGSVFQFRQPSFWERYHWLVVGTSLFCLLQAALIIGLWFNRSKRKQGEAEATLLAEISSKFVNLPPNEVDHEIIQAQRRICQFLDLDLSVLWQVQEGSGDFIATHAYQRQESTAQSPLFRQEDFPWVRGEMVAGRTVMFTSAAEMPVEAAKDRESVSRFGIRSTLTIPLSVGGEQPLGVLSFNAMREERAWPNALVKRLQMVAQIFANTLARKRADQALRESEERLSLAVNSAEAGLWVMDCRTFEFWANEKARTLFGFSRDEVINLARFKESVHSEDWALVQQSLDRAMQAGEPINVEYRIRPGDGRERWIASRGRAFSTANGKPERLQGLSMDITERKRTEEQVRQLSLAVEQSPVAVIITDLEGRMIYVNRKFCEVSGYSSSECLGQNSRILKSGESQPEFYKEMWERIASGRTWRGEFHNRRKNGELYWEWEVISPLFDAAGKITHFVGVKEDVTERKRDEVALSRQRSELTHLSRVAMLGELSGSMAHELNQPLTAILSNAQAAQRFLAGEQADLGEVRDILADIVSEDKRAGEIIRRLRLLLKKGEVQHQPLNVNEVVQEVLKLVRSDLVNQNVTTQTELASDLPVVHGDRVQLQQVLLNLVMNGCEAMTGTGKSARQLTIRTDRAEDGFVRVSVADRGPGITPERLEQIFESFYTTKPQGMGLGLSVCRTIITAHNGRLWATSKPGCGAAVCFTLPANGH